MRTLPSSAGEKSTTRPYRLLSHATLSSRLSLRLFGGFIGYSASVACSVRPAAAPVAACVENQLLGKSASGVPCSALCDHNETTTPASLSARQSGWCSRMARCVMEELAGSPDPAPVPVLAPFIK